MTRCIAHSFGDIRGLGRPEPEPYRGDLQRLLAEGTVWSPDGDDPHTGFSCYGFARYVYRLLGIALPDTADEAEASFAVVPPPYEPFDLLLCSFEPWRGSRHLAVLVVPPHGFHCSQATGGVARFTLTDRLWSRVLLHGLRWRDWAV